MIEIKFPLGETPRISDFKILYREKQKMKISSEQLVTCKKVWNGEEKIADWTVVGKYLPKFNQEKTEISKNGRNFMHLMFKEPKEFLSLWILKYFF